MLIFSTSSFARASQCDHTFYATLRDGEEYKLSNTVNNPSDGVPFLVKGFTVEPPISDYNGDAPFPDFSFADWLTANDRPKKRHNVVMPGESGKLIKADDYYKIDRVPNKRDKKNMLVRYKMIYSNWVDDAWQKDRENVDCMYYEISWCGDGQVEPKYGEQCDPKDPNKKNWGTDGCTQSTCKPKNKPHDKCDQSFYDKLRAGGVYELTDTFTNTGEVDLKLNSYKVDAYRANDFSKLGFPKVVWGVSDKLVKPNQKVTSLKTKRDYELDIYPLKRKKDNIFIKYGIGYFAKDKGEIDKSVEYYYNTCQFYEITWCGDGVFDKKYEQCDPADPNKQNWGSGGCSKTCKAIN